MDDPSFRYDSNYPSQCPPSDAVSPEKLRLFRICKYGIQNSNGELNEKNFIPVCENKKRNFPPKKECISKALSFLGTLTKCKEMEEKYPNLGSKQIEVILNNKCGMIKKTNSLHYSLWDFKHPCICEAIGNDWKEVK
jgi:hypothetical protein